MTGFESSHPVAVTQVGPREWELTHELVYHGSHQTFVVPPGASTDFASVPAILTWLVPTTTGVAAAVLHDWLWRVEAPAGRIAWRDADGLLRQALGTLGVSAPRRWVMWAAVRIGALTRPGGWRGWWRDAPAVLTIALPVAVLASPAVLLVPPWALFAAVECLTTKVTAGT
jgi:hypothetical protein